MSTLIQLRRGTAAEWSAANPVLASGEIGLETDTGLFKGTSNQTNARLSGPPRPELGEGYFAFLRFLGFAFWTCGVGGVFSIRRSTSSGEGFWRLVFIACAPYHLHKSFGGQYAGRGGRR